MGYQTYWVKVLQCELNDTMSCKVQVSYRKRDLVDEWVEANTIKVPRVFYPARRSYGKWTTDIRQSNIGKRCPLSSICCKGNPVRSCKICRGTGKIPSYCVLEDHLKS